MKSATIILPYMSIAIDTGVIPNSLESLSDLPVAMKTVASARTGVNTNLYFYVTKGSGALPSIAYNEEQIVAQMARKIAEIIRENDLLDDGTGKIYQKIALEHVRRAEELLRELPFSESEINTNRDFFLWVATEGRSLAKTLLRALEALEQPGHDSHVMFTVGHGDADDESVGSLCLKKSGGGRVTGNVYLGNRPEMAELEEDDDTGGVGGLVRSLMKKSIGLKKHRHAVVFDRVTPIGTNSTATRSFTAVLTMPYEVADWFKEGALGKIVNDAIDHSLAKTVEAFGL